MSMFSQFFFIVTSQFGDEEDDDICVDIDEEDEIVLTQFMRGNFFNNFSIIICQC